MADDGGSVLLTTLPDGARVMSTLLTDQSPPRHVYRVLTPAGTVEQELATLIELNAWLRSRTADRPG